MKLEIKVLGALLFGAILIGCEQKKNNTLTSGTPLGAVDERLEEASGLVASHVSPGMLWTLNDSGNPAEVFLIDQHAKIRMVCTLLHCRNRDWEDIAIGAGPVAGKKYIYVADIGDNWAQYELKFIYRFEEPRLATEKNITVNTYDTLILKMPDGRRDAETVLIDPFTNDLYLISKREERVGVYHTPYPFSRDTLKLNKVMTLPYTRIVAGSICSDGTEVLLKDYEKVYFWKRSRGENLAMVLMKKPIELPYEREYRGEAIAWSLGGDEFYTLSEGTSDDSANLFVYPLRK